MDEANDILVVDDDDSIRDALAEYLQQHGYSVRIAADARGWTARWRMHGQGLIVLDWMMPGEDGLSVCRRLQHSGIPILMLSAMASTPDRVVGLEMGADDYLAKPFEPRELLARVRALLRRQQKLRPPGAEAEVLRFNGWLLQVAQRRVLAPGGGEVALTQGEFALLQTLAERAGRVLSRERLMQLTRGDEAEPFDRAVDLAISRLRRKLVQADSAATGFIQTLRGEGYRFTAAVQRA